MCHNHALSLVGLLCLLIVVSGRLGLPGEEDEVLRELKQRYRVARYPEHQRLLQGYSLVVGGRIARFTIASFEYDYRYPYFVGTSYELIEAPQNKNAHPGAKRAARVLLQVHRTCQEAVNQCLRRWGRWFSYMPRRGNHTDGNDIGDISLVTHEGLAFARRNVTVHIVKQAATSGEVDEIARAVCADIDKIAENNGVRTVLPPRIRFDVTTEENVQAYYLDIGVSGPVGVEFDWRVHVSSRHGILGVGASKRGVQVTCAPDVTDLSIHAFAITRDGFVSKQEKSFPGPCAHVEGQATSELRKLLQEPRDEKP